MGSMGALSDAVCFSSSLCSSNTRGSVLFTSFAFWKVIFFIVACFDGGARAVTHSAIYRAVAC